jgi:hypothetical protein
MRKSWILGGLFSLLPVVAHAGDAECIREFNGRTSYPNASIRLNSPTPEVRYDHSRPRKSLTQESQTHIAHAKDTITNGLTVSTLASDLNAAMSIMQLPDGSTCVWPEKVEVNLGYSDLVVYIGSDLKRGSCQFDVTMQHEAEHVRIIRNSLRAHVPGIRTMLEHHVASEYPRRIRAGFDPEDETIKSIAAVLQRETREMVRERDKAHALLDSPKSYAYWNGLCDAW